MTVALKLVRGLPPAPGDTSTNEQRSVINLNASSGQPGFGLTINGYNPGYPSLKGSNWIDSTTIDGRRLQSNTIENVTDTIELTITGATWQEVDGFIRAMNIFIRQAREFMTTYNQIEPIYLEWQHNEAIPAQYAGVFNIDASYQIDRNSSTPNATATLVVEREGAWRAVPPGANPKLYTFYANGGLPGSDYDWDDMSLDDVSATFWATSGTLYNKGEYGATARVMKRQNWLTIPKENIPGDAPALCSLYVNLITTATNRTSVYVARIAKPAEMNVQRDGSLSVNGNATRPRPLFLNGGDAHLSGAGVTKVMDAINGVEPINSATNGVAPVNSSPKRVARWGANATYAEWGNPTGLDAYDLDLNSMRGKYLAFARGYQTGGSAGDVNLQLAYAAENRNQQELDTVAAVRGVGAVQTTFLGIVTLPIGGERAFMNDNGRGLWSSDYIVSTSATVKFRLNVTGTTAGTTYSLIDIILIPFDEEVVNITKPTGNLFSFVLDNSGYYRRDGLTVQGCSIYDNATVSSTVGSPELRGGNITLLPGVDNILSVFQLFDDSPTAAATENANAQHALYLDIVPRWYGARDE